MKLEELLRETDALTYINSLKVTLTEIKDEISEQDQLRDHINQSAEKTRKLMRKADNQYRLIAKLASRQAPIANDLRVEDDMSKLDEMKALMEEEV